jgi:hypothetical protein
MNEQLQAERQQLFDTAYRAHVLDRKPLGFTQDDYGHVICTYRKGCAVGVNLSVAELASIPLDSEGDETPGDVFDLWESIEVNSFAQENLHFLKDLQLAHDQASRYMNILERPRQWGDQRVTTDHDYGQKRRSRKGRWYHARRNYKLVAKLYDLTIPS